MPADCSSVRAGVEPAVGGGSHRGTGSIARNNLAHARVRANAVVVASCVQRARMAHRDNAVLDAVASASVGSALVYAVDEVDAAADGVSFNDADAHC